MQWTMFHKGSILNPDMGEKKYVTAYTCVCRSLLDWMGLKAHPQIRRPDFLPVLNCEFSCGYNRNRNLHVHLSPYVAGWSRCWAEASWSCHLHVAAHHQWGHDPVIAVGEHLWLSSNPAFLSVAIQDELCHVWWENFRRSRSDIIRVISALD